MPRAQKVVVSTGETAKAFLQRRIAECRKKLLGLERGDWVRISEDTGLNYTTVYRIARSRATPTPATLDLLLAWFPAREKATETLRRELSKASAG